MPWHLGSCILLEVSLAGGSMYHDFARSTRPITQQSELRYRVLNGHCHFRACKRVAKSSRR